MAKIEFMTPEERAKSDKIKHDAWRRSAQKQMKIKREEFEGNVTVLVLEKEVRVWVCKEGVNIFRFKALGKVYEGQQDVTVIGSDYITEECPHCARMLN